jgi:DNA recombination protein RmuC
MQAIENTDLILVVAGLAGLLLVGLLYSLRQYQNANRELQSRLESSRQQEHSLRESLHEAEKNTQQKQLLLDKERELGAQKIEQFEQNRRQLKIEFENLANKILEDKARAFARSTVKTVP